MRKKSLLIILLILSFILSACSQGKVVKNFLEEPQYDMAIYRAEPGFVFYEDSELVGIDIPAVGIFLFNYKSNEVLAAFSVPSDDPSLGELYPQFTKDKENILLKPSYDLIDIPSGVETLKEQAYLYNIKSKKIRLVDKDSVEVFKKEEEWDFHLSGELDNGKYSWELKDFKFRPGGSDTDYYLFKDLVND